MVAAHHAKSLACESPLIVKTALGGSDVFPRLTDEDTSRLDSCLLTLRLQLLMDLVASVIF